MDFREHIRDMARAEARVLEIGPSYNPIAPKRDGFNVSVMDHADAAALREKYAAFGIDTSRIEDVDFVTVDLSSVKSSGARFDLVIGSHVIEHSTDLIGFINQCDGVLAETGKVALIVPDKRYCFDVYRPVSTIGGAIDAHLAKRSRHVGGLFDHYAYFCLNGSRMAWGANDPSDLKVIHTSEQCIEALKSGTGSDGYVDAHEWVFTPSSLRLLIGELRKAGFIRVGIESSHPTLGYEFLCVLSRSAAEDDMPRADLLRMICEEEFDAFTARRGDMHRLGVGTKLRILLRRFKQVDLSLGRRLKGRKAFGDG